MSVISVNCKMLNQYKIIKLMLLCMRGRHQLPHCVPGCPVTLPSVVWPQGMWYCVVTEGEAPNTAEPPTCPHVT